MSAWLFTEAPRFHKATSINLGISLSMAIISAGLIFYFHVCNTKKREEVERLVQMHGQGTGHGEWDSPEEQRRLGDRHPRFKFTL